MMYKNVTVLSLLFPAVDVSAFLTIFNNKKLHGLSPTERPPLVGEVIANFCG
jgi:hypothetical protein